MHSRRWLVGVSLVVHFAVIFGLFVAGMWQMERLEAGKHHIDLAVALPPPAPSGGGPARPQTKFVHKPLHVVHEIVLPERRVTIETPVATVATGTGDDSGSGSGAGSGSGSAASTGPCTEDCGETRQAAPLLHQHPPLVAPLMMRALWLSGEKQLQPPDPIKTAMVRDGHPRSIATFKVCIGTAGEVVSVGMLKSSGYAAYDGVLTDGIFRWRYRPYTVDGHAISVCSVVTFLYEMK